MKKLLIMPIILMSCMQDISKKPSEPEFNPQKDSIITGCLKEKPILFSKRTNFLYDNIIIYTIRFKNYEFTIVHKLQIPYESKEEWDYYCTDINGNDILIDPVCNFPEDRCSKRVIEKLKEEYCLTHK